MALARAGTAARAPRRPRARPLLTRRRHLTCCRPQPRPQGDQGACNYDEEGPRLAGLALHPLSLVLMGISPTTSLAGSALVAAEARSRYGQRGAMMIVARSAPLVTPSASV